MEQIARKKTSVRLLRKIPGEEIYASKLLERSAAAAAPQNGYGLNSGANIQLGKNREQPRANEEDNQNRPIACD